MRKYPDLCASISQETAVAGWGYFVFELFFLPSLLLAANAKLGLSTAAVNFTYYLINFLCVAAIFRSFLARSAGHAGKHPGRFVLAAAAGFLACWAVGAAVSAVLKHIDPGFANINDRAILNMYLQHPALMFIGTVFFVPVAEECLFRGLIFSQLHRSNAVLAYAVSALAFCTVHVMGYWGTYPTGTLLLCFMQYIPAGLLLAWSYRFSGTVLAPILVHAAINATAILL